MFFYRAFVVVFLACTLATVNTNFPDWQLILAMVLGAIFIVIDMESEEARRKEILKKLDKILRGEINE